MSLRELEVEPEVRVPVRISVTGMIVDYIVTYIILTDHDDHGSSADSGLRGYAGHYITDISHDACSLNKYNTDVGRSTLTRRGHGYYY
jgi:hypothetical protein